MSETKERDDGAEGEEETKKVKVVEPIDSLTLSGALAGIVGDDTFADVRFIVGTGKKQR